MLNTKWFNVLIIGLLVFGGLYVQGSITNGSGGNTITIGTTASLPANSATAGNTYQATDGPYKYVWNGSTWSMFYGSILMTNPATPAYAWTNQGTATVSTTTGAVILTALGSATDSLKVRDIAVPTAPYSITISFSVTADTNNFISAGLSLRDSGSGKLTTLSLNETGKITRAQWTNVTTFSAQAIGAQVLPAGSPFLCFKVVDDNTNRLWYYSMDGGYTFQLYLSEVRTTFITPTHVGFFVDSNNSKPVVLTLLGWTQGVS